MTFLTTRVLSNATRSYLHNLRRLHMDKANSAFSRKSTKVSVVGAAGGIGQPLSLLLKLNPLVKELALVDVMNIDGMALDLSHINTSCQVSGYEFSNFDKAIERSDIVVISAGIPRKPGMTRDDLFKTNADIVGNIILKLINVPVMPYIAIITNPINSIVPFAGGLLELRANPGSAREYLAKLFGITCLDSTRASTFYASHLVKNPSEITVPVIGGHSDTTMLPLFSQSTVPLMDELVAKELIRQVKEAGTNVVKAKKGAGSATLSMAFAASTFVNTLLEAHHGKVTSECAFVRQDPSSKKCKYFADMCVFNETGLEKIINFEHLTPYESNCLEEIKSLLDEDIKKGEEYAREYNLKNK